MSQVSSSQKLKEKGPNTSRSSDEEEAPINVETGEKSSRNSIYGVLCVLVIAMLLVILWRSVNSPILYTDV